MRNAAVISTILVVFLMTGCGGGGGGSFSDTPTRMETPVNVTSINSIYSGTAQTGTEASFSLTGSDLQGNSWTGTYNLISDGTTTFEGQNVTSSRSVLTLQKLGGAPSSQVTTRYFQSVGLYKILYKIVDSFGRLISLWGWVPLPDVPFVGEGGTSAASVSDGTTALIGWKLDPDVNGNSKLTFSTVTKTSENSIVSQGDDSFYIDSLGNVYKMTVVVTTGGTTVTLAGRKN